MRKLAAVRCGVPQCIVDVLVLLLSSGVISDIKLSRVCSTSSELVEGQPVCQ